jgi:PucR family transcriptional regulator, purine catabolism regulatory protein
VSPLLPTTLRLGDLLEHQELGLRLVAGPEDARNRRVLGVHAIEIEVPSIWLGDGWVMLTTGLRLRGHKQLQRQLIEELAGSGVAALGFAEEVVLRRVPAPMIEAANELGFPLFVVPLRTPFRDVITAVHQALLSTETRRLQRIASLQRYLTDALNSQDPGPTILERLCAALSLSAIVSDDPEHGVGAKMPHAEILAALRDRPAAPQEITVGRWRMVASPVESSVRGVAVRWLVAGSQGGVDVSGLGRSMVESAASLLAVASRLDVAAGQQRRAVLRGLLADLLNPAPELTASLEERAQTASVQWAGCRIVALAPREGRWSRGESAALIEQLEDALAAAGQPAIAVARKGIVFGLASDPDVGAHLGELLAEHPGARVGIGRAAVRLTDLALSGSDAQVALTIAGEDTPAVAYEDLPPGVIWALEVPAQRLGPRFDALVDLLAAQPSLHEAVVAWFEHDLDVVGASKALHLHPNSLRYRLHKLEEALGEPLRRPSTIAGLFVALTAARDVLGRPAGEAAVGTSTA